MKIIDIQKEHMVLNFQYKYYIEFEYHEYEKDCYNISLGGKPMFYNHPIYEIEIIHPEMYKTLNELLGVCGKDWQVNPRTERIFLKNDEKLSIFLLKFLN